MKSTLQKKNRSPSIPKNIVLVANMVLYLNLLEKKGMKICWTFSPVISNVVGTCLSLFIKTFITWQRQDTGSSDAEAPSVLITCGVETHITLTVLLTDNSCIHK